ncbi:MAG: hypothetical protein R3335_00975 [Anaerolineales bacterium]|nr:hypothetical protein [Anaerolineales bacterium]
MKKRLLLGLFWITITASLTACNMPAATETPNLTSATAPVPTGTAPGGLPSATFTPANQPDPTSTAPPTETAPPSPTPAPRLAQLTGGGCCAGPSWAPDSSAVLYIDKPSPNDPAGLWSVDLEGGPPQFTTDRLGILSPDWAYRAYPQGDVTIIERLADGQQWTLANGGRPVAFAPGNELLAWTAGQSGPPFDIALREVWISNLDGTGARQVYQATGGGLVGWRTSSELLISQRGGQEGPTTTLWLYSLATGQAEQVLQVSGRLRGTSLSPDGRWLAHQVTFSGEPDADGIWVTNLETRQQRHLPEYGAYQWRDNERLLVIPLEPGAAAHRIMEVEAASGEVRPLTDPAVTPLHIANGDWRVSPDGQNIAFVSGVDHNIWLLTLPL